MTFARPEARVGQARAILDFLTRWVPTENNAYGLLLKSETEGLRSQPDYYILHEHLEDTNEPLYFHEFAERASRHGLAYLGEAEFGAMLASNFPAEVGETVRRIAPDVIRQEQFMDFLRNRTFRQTLLVHGDAAIQRNVAPERVTALWAASALQPAAPPDLAEGVEAIFRGPAGALRTPHSVTKAAMLVLTAEWPRALSFAELLGATMKQLADSGIAPPAPPAPAPRETLASDLLQCYACGLIEFHATPPPFTAEVSERPVANPLARWQAAQGQLQLTGMKHQVINVDDNLRRLVPLLDGSRRRGDLYRTVTEWLLASPAGMGKSRRQLAEPVQRRVDEALGHLAHGAVLVA
jgi:hypothetical protein